MWVTLHKPGIVDKNKLIKVKVRSQASVIYLGSKILENCKTIESVKQRVTCVVDRLNDRVFKRSSVRGKLKGYFTSSVFSSLFYDLEHCAFRDHNRRCLDSYSCSWPTVYYTYVLTTTCPKYMKAGKRLGVDRPSVQLVFWTFML